jgi:hypothetical protein
MVLMPMTVAKTNEGFDGILYGDPKTGKTTTLGECGYKVLLADLEGGTAVLEGAENVTRIPIESWEDLILLGKSIRQGYIDMGADGKFPLDEFELVAIDSISRMQDLCKEWVAKTYAPGRKREISGKFGAQMDWGDLKDNMTKLVKAFHTFTKAGDKSKHVIWIAHKAVTTDDITGNPTSTKIQLQGKDTAEIIMSIVDGVMYMTKRNNKDTGEVEYGILTKRMGIFEAEVRQSKFNKNATKLENFIVNPHWKSIFETLGYQS